MEKRDALLREALYRATEASRAKTDFLAKMSHEIRTPMNAIIGMSELALREDTPEAKNEHIVAVKQAGANLLGIINDILDFSKIEAGKIDVVRKPYSMTSLINDVVSIIRMRAVSAQISFIVKVDSSTPEELLGDETKMRQTLLNVLGNAVKYTDEGSVVLSVMSEYLDKETVSVTFEVSDSGIGIREEDMDKLFSDFTQLDLEKNEGIEGVGLGLVITRSIVEAMGGSISVKSDYGKGSVFTITVPQTVSSFDPIAAVRDVQSKSVLIYERRDIYTDSLTYALRNLGVDFSVVTDASWLYKAMENRKYTHLFISYELLEKNENIIHNLNKDTELVILTDFGETAPPESRRATLAMPVYCTHIADILNGVKSEPTGRRDNDFSPQFTAPKAKVLVVDDIKTNLIVAKGLLKPYGMQIDVCDGGAKAIEAVKAVRYDMVFMDHKMPGMDGVEATKAIREMGIETPFYNEMPIIALTANAVSGMREVFLESGFSDFLSKPIDMFELSEILEKWIREELRE